MNPDATHREQLSALIDGALDADQRRFLLRRLQHDGALADNLSRWQMAGDVLRGQADAPAAPGFAEMVAARIAAEPQPLIEGEGVNLPVRAGAQNQADVGVRAPAPRAARWRWFGGGAMAASLAIAGMLALRPEVQTTGPTEFAAVEAASPSGSDAATPVAATASVVASAATNRLAATPLTQPEPKPQPAAPMAASAAARGNDAPRAPVRVARAAPAPSAASSRAPRAETELPRVLLPEQGATRSAQVEALATANPFQPPAAKPWPRAVIPGAGNGTFNASLDGDAGYYPFAPHRVEPTGEE